MTAGLKAQLSASFDRAGGRTHSRISTQAPLDLRGPLRADRGKELYFLRNSTCGILGGDAFDIDVTVSGGSDVQVASPSSTKVYSMKCGAESRVCLEAEAGSRLIWGPHPLILQQESDFRQQTTVKLAGGIVMLCEILVMGRLARGESGRFRRFASELQVWASGSEPLYEERFVLQPEADNCLDTSLGGFGALASVYALGLPDGAQSRALTALSEVTEGLSGASTLPNGAGVVGRALAGSLSEAHAFCEVALCRLRSDALFARGPAVGCQQSSRRRRG